MIEIKKTDGRHTGHGHFAFYATVKREYRRPSAPSMSTVFQNRLSLIKEYNDLRKWCVDTWGMSCDRTHYLELVDHDPAYLNTHWCWHTEYNELKIYMKSDKESNWMKLRWS